MNRFIFCIVMNFIAAVVLFNVDKTSLNNLGTRIPALLCFIAGIRGIIEIRKYKKNK